jgi:hypothetical protein
LLAGVLFREDAEGGSSWLSLALLHIWAVWLAISPEVRCWSIGR